MPLLYYWKPDNYYRDLDFGASYHLNQKNPLLHEIEIGDSLWALTRNRKTGRYVLAAELVIKAKTFNPDDFRYGKYRVWGSLVASRYFNINNQPDAEPIIRALGSIKANAEFLGQAFQGYAAVRRLARADHLILLEASRNYALEPRASSKISEENLEKQLLYGTPQDIQSLVEEEALGLSVERRQYLYTQAPLRNRQYAEELQEMYGGRCQICQWNPLEIYGFNLCHAHHIQWLSRGGKDGIENMLLVCPNHHGAIHRGDAPLDFGSQAFLFDQHTERITLNRHLQF